METESKAAYAPAEDDLVGVFGYGSLVNRRTHRSDIFYSIVARVIGWRRCWRNGPALSGVKAALLTVHQEEEAHCDGVINFIHRKKLEELDVREVPYIRRAAPLAQFELFEEPPARCPLYIYEAREHAPLTGGVILQSYLDTVFLGYLAAFGEAGVIRFVAETQGFDAPILRDRQTPIFPRAIAASQEECALFDHILCASGAHFTRDYAAAS